MWNYNFNTFIFIFVFKFGISNSQNIQPCNGSVEKEIGTPVISSIKPTTSKTTTPCIFDFSNSLKNSFNNATDIRDYRVSARLSVSDTTHIDTPLLFTVIRQDENVRIVKLPFTYYEEPIINETEIIRKSKDWYYEAGGTLCFDQTARRGEVEKVQLAVKVELPLGINDTTIHFRIEMKGENGLFVRLSDETEDNTITTALLSPTVSTFIGFDFSDSRNKGVKNVTIIVKPILPNPPCLMLSFQNPLCPIQDTEQTILFKGKAFPMHEVGIKHGYQHEFNDRQAYNGGFVVVLVVMSDDSACTNSGFHSEHEEQISQSNRSNIYEVKIIESPWDTNKISSNTNLQFYLMWYLPILSPVLIFIITILLWIILVKYSSKACVIPRKSVFDIEPRILTYVVYVKDLVLSDFYVGLGKTHHRNIHHEFKSETIVTNIHYFVGLAFVVVFRVVTLSETMDLSLCYYSRLCSYQKEFFGMMFFMWNSIASASAFLFGGFIYYIYLRFIRWTYWPDMNKNTVQQVLDVPDNERTPLLGKEYNTISTELKNPEDNIGASSSQSSNAITEFRNPEDNINNGASSSQSNKAVTKQVANIEDIGTGNALRQALHKRKGRRAKQEETQNSSVKSTCNEKVDATPNVLSTNVTEVNLETQILNLNSEIESIAKSNSSTSALKTTAYNDAAANKNLKDEDEESSKIRSNALNAIRVLRTRFVCNKNCTCNTKVQTEINIEASEDTKFGIPPKVGLELALAAVLMLEGFMSFFYHVCPNFGSFLFDAPITDLILILSWIRIFCLRYPLYMNTYLTTVIAFCNIAFELFLTLGHYKNRTHSYLYIGILFLKVLFFNTLIFAHSFYIYYLGHYRIARSEKPPVVITYLPTMFHVWSLELRCNTFLSTCCPNRPFDFFVHAFTIVCNAIVTWTLFALYIYSHENHHLLNPEVMIQITEYNIMFAIFTHLCRRFYYEGLFFKTNIFPTICFLCHLIAHFAQLYFYNQPVFDWSLTHPESMDMNRECFDYFYDLHDYYHFTKSLSYFFLFMTITTINDGATYIRRDKIRVF